MHPVELTEMLQARDLRAQRQRELLKAFDTPLICFTMNIAGPVKNGPEILWAFRYGCTLVRRQLNRVKAALLHEERRSAVTGNEAFFAVEYPPGELKALMVELEEGTELGRLFDLDVLAPDGRKLERSAQRRCLICGAAGKGCARSRAHSVEELQAKTGELLSAALRQWKRETAGELACRALLYEACATPKPGLVDRRNTGSHQDMDQFTFLSSAAALQSYFSQCAAIGAKTASEPPETTFAALRGPGKLAELRMLEATDGVNTHKGAIFTLGVLCGALGRLEPARWTEPERILQLCAAMTEGLSRRELKPVGQTRTAGERLYQAFGTTGVRGQMEQGLPAVVRYGLPALERAVQNGRTLEQAGCAALLSLIAHVDDTNLLHRGGPEGQRWARAQCEALLQRTSEPSDADLEALNAAFVARNLSPGGAADLLAVCYFLFFLKTHRVLTD